VPRQALLTKIAAVGNHGPTVYVRNPLDEAGTVSAMFSQLPWVGVYAGGVCARSLRRRSRRPPPFSLRSGVRNGLSFGRDRLPLAEDSQRDTGPRLPTWRRAVGDGGDSRCHADGAHRNGRRALPSRLGTDRQAIPDDSTQGLAGRRHSTVMTDDRFGELDFVANKRARRRHKDLGDIEALGEEP